MVAQLLPVNKARQQRDCSLSSTNVSWSGSASGVATGDRIAVLQSPREVMKRLEVLRGIMFSTQTGGGSSGFGVAPTVYSGPSSPRLAGNQAPALRRSRKPRGKHLPPLAEDYTGDYMSCNLG